MGSLRWGAVIVGALLGFGLSGCAYVSVDEDGRQRIIGFVYLDLPSPEKVNTPAMRLRAVGMQLMHTPWGSSFSLGYSDQAFLALSNDSCVRFSSLQGVLP
ncbi:hypothetical protein [Aquabacterium sp.]|uniref:hypothetical protein n=1 Tax=Aquabacterium sp. TaxID=1872578 RepID=UPI003D6D75DA